MSRALASSDAAFSRLVERHQAAVRGFLRRALGGDIGALIPAAAMLAGVAVSAVAALALASSDAAFSRLVERHQAAVRGFLRRALGGDIGALIPAAAMLAGVAVSAVAALALARRFSAA